MGLPDEGIPLERTERGWRLLVRQRCTRLLLFMVSAPRSDVLLIPYGNVTEILPEREGWGKGRGSTPTQGRRGFLHAVTVTGFWTV